MSGERSTTHFHDHDLTCNNNKLNADEKPVSVHPLQDVEVVVESSVVVLIENLHPNKSIEHQSLQLCLLAFALIGEERSATEIQDERD